MIYSGTPLSNENKNPLHSTPNRLLNADESTLSPLTSRSRIKRTSLHGPVGPKSPSPTSPNSLSNDFKSRSTVPAPEDNIWEQELDKVGKYLSIIQSTFKKESELKKDVIVRLHKEMTTLKYENEDMAIDLRGKEELISRLASETETYQMRIKQLEQKLAFSQEQNLEYRQREEEYQAVQRDFEDLQLELKRSQDSLKSKDKEIGGLKVLAVNREDDLKEKEYTIQFLTQQFSSLKQHHEAETERLTKELEMVKLDNITLEKKCTTIRDKADILLLEFEQNQLVLETNEKRIQAQELAIQRLVSEHETSVASLMFEKSSLSTELEKAQSSTKALQSEIKNATLQRAELTKKMNDANSQNETLNEEVLRLSGLLEKKESNSQAYHEQVEQLQSALKAQEEKVLDLENDLTISKNATNTLSSQLQEAKLHLTKVQAQWEESRNQCRVLDSRIRHLTDGHEKAESEFFDRIAEFESQVSSLENKLQSSESKHSELQSQLDQVNEENQKLTSELESKFDQLCRLESEHALTFKQLEESRQHYDSISQQRESLDSTVQLLRDQLSTTKLFLEKKEAQYELHSKEMETLRQEKVKVDIELHSMKASWDGTKLQVQRLTDLYNAATAAEEETQIKLRRKMLEVEESQSEIESLKSQLKEVQQSLSEFESAHDKHSMESSTIENQLTELRNELQLRTEQYEKDRDRLQISVSTQMSIAKHLASERDYLETQLHSARKRLDEMQDSYDTLMDEQQRKEGLCRQLEEKCAKLQEECHFLKTHSAAVESKYTGQAKALKEIEESLSKRYAQEKGGLESKLATVMLAKDVLKAEFEKKMASNTEKISYLEKENASFKEKLSRNETTLNELHSQLNTKAILLHRYHQQSAEAKQKFEMELERKESQLKTQQMMITNLSKKLESVQNSVNVGSQYIEQSEPLEEASAFVDTDLLRKFERLQSRNRSLEDEIRELRETISHLNESSLTKHCQALEKQISTLRIEQENVLKENRQLNAKLDIQHDLLVQNSDLSTQVAMLDEINTNLLGHQNPNQKIRYLIRVKEECIRLREQLSNALKERDQNRILINDLEDELNALRSVQQTGSKKRMRLDLNLAVLTPNIQ